MQYDQVLHKAGLVHQDKVQTRRQTGQVTVTMTHNREEGRRDGWRREGEAIGKTKDRGTRGRRAGREGGGRHATGYTGCKRWWIEGPQGSG